jgi:hypothetical protein
MGRLGAPLTAAHLYIIPDDEALFVPKIFNWFEHVCILRYFGHVKISLVYARINFFKIEVVYIYYARYQAPKMHAFKMWS